MWPGMRPEYARRRHTAREMVGDSCISAAPSHHTPVLSSLPRCGIVSKQ